MLRDTSMANAKSRSTCSAARANVIWVRTSDTNGSTHVLPMLSTPDDSATHPMLLVASYQNSVLEPPDGGFAPVEAVLRERGRLEVLVRRGTADRDRVGQLEVLDALLVNLVERRVTLRIGGAAVYQPVLRFSIRINQPIRRHFGGDRWSRHAQNSGCQENESQRVAARH